MEIGAHGENVWHTAKLIDGANGKDSFELFQRVPFFKTKPRVQRKNNSLNVHLTGDNRNKNILRKTNVIEGRILGERDESVNKPNWKCQSEGLAKLRQGREEQCETTNGEVSGHIGDLLRSNEIADQHLAVAAKARNRPVDPPGGGGR